MMPFPVAEAEKSIGVVFKNKDLLRQAFIHRSFLNENPSESLPHNERLEYLGDAVMELIVSEYLFTEYPDRNEGDLTAFRSSLVNTNSISECASKLGMNSFLLLSRGEAKDTGRARQYILANTFESVLGALYLDQGYDAARAFLARVLLPNMEEIVEKKLWLDAKSYFQEKAQEYENITPTYRVTEESGPDHAKQFVVGVYIGSSLVASGRGHSKQEAEQSAAREGLAKKQWL